MQENIRMDSNNSSQAISNSFILISLDKQLLVSPSTTKQVTISKTISHA
jgi:hypothetical protein